MRARFKRFWARFHRDEAGKMSVEMILLLALIALPIIILLVSFRKTIVEWFKGQSSQLQDPGQGG